MIDWISELRNKPAFDPRQYNFPPLSPGGSLSVGSNTITLNPMPLGITSSFIGQQLYISGGTGTVEAVTVTGWSSTTVTVTCANTHSGAWTVQSATGGGAEALTAGASAIYFPSETPATFYGTLVIPGSRNISFFGDSFWTPAIVRGANNVTGDLFYAPGATNYSAYANLAFSNLSITNGPAQTGRAIHVVWGTLNVNQVRCTDGIWVDHDSTQLSQIDNFYYFSSGTPAEAVMYRATAVIAAGNTNVASTNSSISNGSFYMANSGQYGVQTNGTDFLILENVKLVGMDIGLFAQPDTSSYIANLFAINSHFDAGQAGSAHGIDGARLQGRAGSNFGNVFFIACIFGGENNTVSEYGLDMTAPASGNPITNVIVSGCEFTGWGIGGIGMVHVPGAGDHRTVITGSVFTSNNAGVAPTNSGGIYMSTPQGVTISANAIDANTGYGIYWIGVSQSSGVSITGGADTGNSTGPLFIDGVIPQGTIIDNVQGLTNLLPAVASAATFVFPLVTGNFTITGTTNMTAATTSGIPPNSGGTFRCTGGNITITAGGGWGNSITCNQNALMSWFFDGTSIWVK
jgi:hypothetical protein